MFVTMTHITYNRKGWEGIYCGGTIINTHTVVTAFHCILEYYTVNLRTAINKEDIIVTVG